MTNKKNIVMGLFVLTTLILGAGIANAATYQYVNTSGQISTITANSASEALANAHNLGAHSGVILISGTSSQPPVTETTQPNQYMYQYVYVNSFGVVSTVNANSSAEALAKAINIDVNSGIMKVSNTFDENLIGNSVSVQ